MPDLAIIDPQFTMTVPPKITAATGLDALFHVPHGISNEMLLGGGYAPSHSYSGTTPHIYRKA